MEPIEKKEYEYERMFMTREVVCWGNATLQKRTIYVLGVESVIFEILTDIVLETVEETIFGPLLKSFTKSFYN